MQHRIVLSNGQELLVEESQDRLTIGYIYNGCVDAYLCQIDVNGVLVYTNSGSACQYLVEYLPVISTGDKVVWVNPSDSSDTRHGTVQYVVDNQAVLTNGDRYPVSELRHQRQYV